MRIYSPQYSVAQHLESTGIDWTRRHLVLLDADVEGNVVRLRPPAQGRQPQHRVLVPLKKKKMQTKPKATQANKKMQTRQHGGGGGTGERDTLGQHKGPDTGLFTYMLHCGRQSFHAARY